MKKYFIIILLILSNFPPAYSLIEVDITRGNLDPLPVAISPLYVDTGSEKTYEAKMVLTIQGLDLEHEIIGKIEG